MMHSTSSRKPSTPTASPRLALISLCVICAVSLQACGGTLPVCQTESPPLPSLPSVSTPQPAQPYSKSWQSEVADYQSVVQRLRDKLMATPLMSGSSSKQAK